MIARNYALIWILIAASGLAAYVTDSFSTMKLIFYGFIVSGLIFIGLIGILPTVIKERESNKRKNDVGGSSPGEFQTPE